ncbi:MAG: hypothetical protein H6953_11485 [Chromatiaceae bacterium]|nr:hypothetical protein [Chromatiaceae bacterium]MCP5316028.1 hypothetical protein [Chromatiaceae bacterium]
MGGGYLRWVRTAALINRARCSESWLFELCIWYFSAEQFALQVVTFGTQIDQDFVGGATVREFQRCEKIILGFELRDLGVQEIQPTKQRLLSASSNLATFRPAIIWSPASRAVACRWASTNQTIS